MFGDKYLSAPVLDLGLERRNVYLPKNSRWARLVVEEDAHHGEDDLAGGQATVVDTPIHDLPIFVRRGGR